MEETRDENCVERQTVKRLENMAIEASFNQILRFVRQCPDQKKTGDSPSEPSTDSGSPFSPSEEHVIEITRGYLDRHLVGTVNAHARYYSLNILKLPVHVLNYKISLFLKFRAKFVKKMYGNFTKFQYAKSMKSFFDMFR